MTTSNERLCLRRRQQRQLIPLVGVVALVLLGTPGEMDSKRLSSLFPTTHAWALLPQTSRGLEGNALMRSTTATARSRYLFEGPLVLVEPSTTAYLSLPLPSSTRLHQSQVFDADKMESIPTPPLSSYSSSNRKSNNDNRKSNNDKNNNKSSNRDDPEWKFFDTARIHVQGGDGGTGCVAFRREKSEARGGPNGGRGGRGGSVYLICDETLNTLMPLRQRVHVRAGKGRNGLGKNKDGCGGSDLYIRAPPGTVVRELHTQQVAGELQTEGQTLLVAKGGRGGRGNAAFMTARRTAPKLAERGEPGARRWLSLELRLVADVGFLGKPNAGKSTLLAAASAARPKIANYPFTTLIPNLGVCDLGQGTGLVLCDIPGLIQGAAQGAGMGLAFLRHVQRCRVLLHLVDGTSEDPINDFHVINQELRDYDEFLAEKPQVVVLNKVDVPEVKEREADLLAQLRQSAGHTRVLSISAATTHNVQELMSRVRKFVEAQPKPELPALPEVDLSKAGLEYDADDYEIQSDPSYPNQWRVSGQYMEQIAKMTHWEYPEAVERFGRQLEALGISDELQRRGAVDGDLIMIGTYDFEFSPGQNNPYIPPELLAEDEARFGIDSQSEEDSTTPAWRPFTKGGFLDIDTEELAGFGDEDDWDLLEFDEKDNDEGASLLSSYSSSLPDNDNGQYYL